MAAKKSAKKTTKKTVKKTTEEDLQERSATEQTVPQPASKQQVPPQKVVQTIKSLNKMWIVIGVLTVIFIIMVGIIFLNTPKTEDVTEEEPEVKEQVELEVGRNYVLIPTIKDYVGREVAVQGLVYPTGKIMYGEFNDLIQDTDKNDLYFKPATRQSYVHKELYAIEGTVKSIEVTAVCQRMYICNQNFVNPYEEPITSEGWINESMEGLSTPKADIKNCIEEDENINLLGHGQCVKQYRYDPESYERIYYIDQATATLE